MAAAAAYGAYFSRNGFIPKFSPPSSMLASSNSSNESSCSSSTNTNTNMPVNAKSFINNKSMASPLVNTSTTSTAKMNSVGTHSDVSDEENENDLDEESFGKI